MSTIVQLGGFIFDIVIDPAKILPKIINKADELSKKVALDGIIKTANTSKKYYKSF